MRSPGLLERKIARVPDKSVKKSLFFVPGFLSLRSIWDGRAPDFRYRHCMIRDPQIHILGLFQSWSLVYYFHFAGFIVRSIGVGCVIKWWWLCWDSQPPARLDRHARLLTRPFNWDIRYIIRWTPMDPATSQIIFPEYAGPRNYHYIHRSSGCVCGYSSVDEVQDSQESRIWRFAHHFCIGMLFVPCWNMWTSQFNRGRLTRLT